MLVREKGVMEVAAYPLGDITLCIVAGNGVGERFYNNFLSAEKKDFQEPYYKEIPTSSSGNTVSIISDGGDATLTVGSTKYDLEDSGFLFTPGENRICFFPTKSGDFSCDGSDLLDDDCFDDVDEEQSVLYKYAHGTLSIC